MTKKIERRGRPVVSSKIAMERGKMFKARIPRALHPAMKRAAKAEGLHLGRWLVELGARAIGRKIEAPKCRVRRKSAA
jgi:hypothetical protein